MISSDPEDLDGVQFLPLFDYEPVFVAAKGYPLAGKEFIEAEDFRDQTLITYPVERNAAGRVHPASDARHGRAARGAAGGTDSGDPAAGGMGRGVSVLPDWVLREVRYHSDYVTKRLTSQGLTRRLYAAVREEDAAKPFMAHVLRLARTGL